jgi:hypothetical protein
MNGQQPAGVTAFKCPQCGGNLPLSTQDSIVCPFCGTSLILNPTRSEVTGGAVIHGMRLKPVNSVDVQGTGMEIFRMLAPAGWQTQGGCTWHLDNPGLPAQIAFRVYNPQGAECFEILPNLNFIWNNNPLGRIFAPPGTRHFGAEVRPPVNISDAFCGVLLPRYRGFAQNLEVLNITPLPDLPRLVKSDAPITPGASAEGGKARIRYTWQNVSYEEELYAVVEIFRAQTGTPFNPAELLIWFIDYIFTFRAAAGRLDATADIFSAMLQSFKPNPNWYAAFKTVAQSLAQQQINRIQHIGQIGQMIAQAGSQMREQNLNDWYRRQEIYDRLSVDRSRAIRDVDGFYDPHSQEVVELPSGYGHAWANNLGEYILTEDSSYNPNLDSTQHWEPMSQQ